MSLRRRFAAITLAVVTTGTVLAGFQAGGASTSGTAAAPIKVMIIAQLTAGESGAAEPQAAAAVKARAKVANKAGELPGGQDIVVEVCDDKENANTAADCARKAVSDGVVAVIGSITSQGDAINPILEAAGIPQILANGLSQSDFSTPNIFQVMSGSPGYLCGAMLRFHEKNLNKVNIAYIDIPVGAQLLGIAGLCMPDGVTLEPAKGTPVPPTSPDLTAAVAAASASSDGILLATLAPSAAQFIKTAKQQAIEQPIMNANAGFTPETLKQLGNTADGVLVTNPAAPLSSKSKGMKAFKAAMKKYAKGEVVDDQFTLGSYVCMDVFVRMLVEQNLTDITAASVFEGMGSLTDLSTDGLIPPLTTSTPQVTFAALSRIFNPFVYPTVIKNGKIVGDGKPYNALELLPT